jgi:hypothetical protein
VGFQPGKLRRWEISKDATTFEYECIRTHLNSTQDTYPFHFLGTLPKKPPSVPLPIQANGERKYLFATSNDTKHTMARKNPNIVVTGTPGVGKTTHAEQLAQATGFQHISINQIVKDEGFHEGKDEETGSWIVDEDKVRINIHRLIRSTDWTVTAPGSPRNSPSQYHRRLHSRLARMRPLPRALDRPCHCPTLRLHIAVRPADSARIQGQEARRKHG